MTDEQHDANSQAGASPVEQRVRRPVPARAVENDCEDQGYSNVSDGCNKWPCKREPLARWALGWICTKCGGRY